MGASFRNIELEITAPFNLERLADAFGDKLYLNYCDKIGRQKYFLAGALAYSRKNTTSDSIAAGLCDVIEKLPPSAMRMWKRAKDRVFDFGMDANEDPRVIVDLVQPKTVTRIGALGARLAVSIYTIDLVCDVSLRYTKKKESRNTAANNRGERTRKPRRSR